jgi:hypothetical protein
MLYRLVVFIPTRTLAKATILVVIHTLPKYEDF